MPINGVSIGASTPSTHAHLNQWNQMIKQDVATNDSNMALKNGAGDKNDVGISVEVMSNNPMRSERTSIKVDQTYLLCVDPI
jgi:hypothetical protein